MADLSERFGKEAYSLYQLADNAGGNPGCPYVFEGRMRRNIALEYAESDAIRLTFLVKSELRPLLESLAAKGRSLASLQIFLELGSKEVRTELIQPAEPTLDERQVLMMRGGLAVKNGHGVLFANFGHHGSADITSSAGHEKVQMLRFPWWSP